QELRRFSAKPTARI
ncbi:phosphoglycolate phosphatase domain protein, partial [Vibrio parahaemolyticus V-223/04]